MSPDLEKYRAMARTEDPSQTYSDDDLLRMWAAMEHLFSRATQETYPQLTAPDTEQKASNHDRGAVESAQLIDGKESNP